MDILISFVTGFAAFSTASTSHILSGNSNIVADVVEAISGPASRIAVLFSPEYPMQATRIIRDLNVTTTIWTCPTSSHCYEMFVRYVTQFPDENPRPGLVLVPQHTTLPLHVLKEIPRFQMYYSNVDWVFAVKEHADVLDKLGSDSCQVITVTQENISAPYDGYRSCQARKHFREPRLLLFKDAPRKGLYPKHERVYYAVRDRPGNYCGKYYGNRAATTIEAYRALNNSLVYRCNNDGVVHSVLLGRRVDIIVGIDSTNCPYRCFAYRYAMYPPVSHYYLARRSTATRPSFLNVWLWFLLLSFLFMVPFAAVFILVLHLRRSFGSQDATSAHAATTFLVSTFLGRSPPPGIDSRATSSKLLLFSWMLGMLFLGSFIQTTITASRSVPSHSPEIRNMRELLERLHDGTILPCTTRSLADSIGEGTDLALYIRTFRQALDRCGNKCALDNFRNYGEECYERIKKGTHVGIFEHTQQMLAEAMREGLEPGQDLFLTTLMHSAAHGRYPLRYQHRLLHMALEESGLLIAVERKRSPMQRQTTLRSFYVPFHDYMLLCAVGCTLSTLVFLVELCCRSRVVQRPKKRFLKSHSHGTIHLSRGWNKADS